MKSGAVLAIVMASFIVFRGTVAHAAVKDSDLDGLTDDAEQQVYGTDPHMFDTDGDAVGDGEEILDGTNPLDPASSRIVTLTASDTGILGEPVKFAWYLGRVSGIVAFILLTMVVVHGLVISSRAFFKVYAPATALEVHRFLSWTALATVVLHFSSFFLDGFIKLTLVEALIPFRLIRDFRSATGFDLGVAVALGIVALYIVIVLILTSEFRSKIPTKLWRATHYLSFVAYVLFVLHGYASGTDSRTWWMKSLYVGSSVLVTALIIVRIIFRNRLQRLRARQIASQSQTPS